MLASILQEKEHFYRALSHLHNVSQHMHDDRFALDGGCPVQSYNSSSASFLTAMEELSLASIMAKMAQDVMDQDEGHEQNKDSIIEGGSGDTSTAAAATSALVVNSTSMQSNHHVTLSEALKSGTFASHQAAQDVHFVRNFIRGSIN